MEDDKVDSTLTGGNYIIVEKNKASDDVMECEQKVGGDLNLYFKNNSL